MKVTLPQVPPKPSSADNKIRSKDAKNKAKAKAYADKHLHAKPSDIQIGDNVLVKHNHRKNMTEPPYNPRPFVVVKRKGNSVTAKSGSTFVTRNVSFFKKLPPDFYPNETVVYDSDFDGELELDGEQPPAPDNAPQPAAARRSTRTTKPPERLKDYVLN